MQPFRVDIPQADLDDLNRRLADTRWPELVDVGWERGVPTAYLKELAEYWRTGFDWRAAEARLNQYPQFTTEIDGEQIHFIHVRSPEPNAIPMIITHGWPGSIVEFLDIIGPLTDPRAHGGNPEVAYDLVIPSMPGYGFSGPLKSTGWDLVKVAQAWAQLMSGLGYDKYVAQGADFGAVASILLGVVDAQHLLGIHLNLLLTLPAGEPGELDDLSDEDRRRLGMTDRFLSILAGSMKQQATRPHTVAYALTDSPVGQLAWIAEKFKDWAQAETAPEDAVDRDLMLTLISIYWLTKTAGSSAQTYVENFPQLPINSIVGRLPTVEVPVGVAQYTHSLFLPVKKFAERDLTNIVYWSEYDRGGHFAAMEEPDLFAADLQAFGQVLRKL
ncbi:epoxide hydrolase family protein [Streptomyces sp. V4-01]|uniref:Epoxide hydrolase family protein n=1 Tax=Actinacidiphila polyblastidii TaxID=3110430 RepID=A0ABU7PHG1_9ACTN|nr:epoxide hydrolase family protein [Streptomyces sp. V4-01]